MPSRLPRILATGEITIVQATLVDLIPLVSMAFEPAQSTAVTTLVRFTITAMSQHPRRSRTNWLILLGSGVLCLIVLGLAWRWQPMPPLVISVETTHITKPLLPDGRPDYAAWLNEIGMRGVTPENNAVAVLLPLLWDDENPYFHYLPVAQRADLFRQLGVRDERPEQVMVSWKKFAREQQLPPGIFKPHQSGLRTATTAGHPNIREWAVRNDALLNEVAAQIVTRDHYCEPYFSPQQEHILGARIALLDQLLPELRHLLSTRSAMRLEQRALPSAADDALLLLRLSQLISQAVRGDPYISAEFHMSAMDSLAFLVHSEHCTVALLEHIHAGLHSLPPRGRIIDTVTTSWRARALDYITALRTSPAVPAMSHNPYDFWSGYTLAPGADVNVLLREVNRRFDAVDKAGRVADPRERLKACVAAVGPEPPPPSWDFPDVVKENLARSSLAPFPNPLHLGNIREFVPATHTPQFFEAEESLSVRETLLLIAIQLRRFQQRTGKHPETLDDLAASTGEPLPLDPWTAQPFRYRRTEKFFLLYSVGANERDDKGAEIWEAPDDREFDDIRFGPLLKLGQRE